MTDNCNTERLRIVLRCPPPRPKTTERLVGMVRISPEAEIALRKLAQTYPMDLSKIASQLIIQAAAVCEFEYD